MNLCKYCELKKPDSDFYKGRRRKCKQCYSEARYGDLAPKDVVRRTKAYTRSYSKENAAAAKNRAKDWYSSLSEEQRQVRRNNQNIKYRESKGIDRPNSWYSSLTEKQKREVRDSLKMYFKNKVADK